jgi:hypothetical protein
MCRVRTSLPRGQPAAFLRCPRPSGDLKCRTPLLRLCLTLPHQPGGRFQKRRWRSPSRWRWQCWSNYRCSSWTPLSRGHSFRRVGHLRLRRQRRRDRLGSGCERRGLGGGEGGRARGPFSVGGVRCRRWVPDRGDGDGGPDVIEVEVVSVLFGDPFDLAEVAQPSYTEGPVTLMWVGHDPYRWDSPPHLVRSESTGGTAGFRVGRCRGARVLLADSYRVLDFKPDSFLSVVHPTQ